ncbi:hypothetical protein DPEC_G00174750 [Dallia pectoralis]|uniref:Uncharacterized protein n=1 Tax=Dallia pectoralis TaxID=75939 RepID=A0ACC2GE89_DALPE|nr:hypothetical protein DPEC_G00174750 [Dallia pectoralis]
MDQNPIRSSQASKLWLVLVPWESGPETQRVHERSIVSAVVPSPRHPQPCPPPAPLALHLPNVSSPFGRRRQPPPNPHSTSNEPPARGVTMEMCRRVKRRFSLYRFFLPELFDSPSVVFHFTRLFFRRHRGYFIPSLGPLLGRASLMSETSISTMLVPGFPRSNILLALFHLNSAPVSQLFQGLLLNCWQRSAPRSPVTFSTRPIPQSRGMSVCMSACAAVSLSQPFNGSHLYSFQVDSG